jgi:hypothetical protein
MCIDGCSYIVFFLSLDSGHKTGAGGDFFPRAEEAGVRRLQVVDPRGALERT